MGNTTTSIPNDLGLPRNGDEPVFAEPWQAQAFAIVVKLQQRGVFTWNEWLRTLSAEIAARPAAPGADANEAYYWQWLAALEGIVAGKELSSRSEMLQRKEDWRIAYLRTPHGQPVDLARAWSDAAAGTESAGTAHGDHAEQDHDDDHPPTVARPVASSPARSKRD